MSTEATNVPERPIIAGWRMWRTSLLNVTLRGSTIVSKFLLLLVMARYLAPTDVGVYGLFVGTISIAIYVIGLDYYVYNTREILAREETDRVALIRDQGVFHLLAYTVTLPLLLTVFLGGFIPWRYIFWFYGLLILEHLAQEGYRLLIILGRPVAANLVAFLRAGVWVWPVLAGMLLTSREQSIAWVLSGWILGVFASVVLAAWYLARLPWQHARDTPIAWRAMRTAAGGAVPFFVGSLALRSVQYADRYFVQHFAGTAMVGVYTFYSSIAGVVQAFVLTGIVEIIYPRIVEAFQGGRLALYKGLMRRLALGSMLVVVLSSGAILLVVSPLLRLIDRPLYADYVGVLWLLLGSAVISTTRWVPHYALYVRRRDLALLTANLIGLVASLSMNAWLVPRFGVYGAGMAAIGANVAIVVATVVAFITVGKREYATA